MTLAIFDLDNTLLGGDSDHAWGDFLVEAELVDGESHRRQNDQFYQDYLNGELDIHRYHRFALSPVAGRPQEEVAAWRARFMDTRIKPLYQRKAEELLASHREQGHTLMIITATNRFITELIAEAMGIEHLLATEPEVVDGRYTGNIVGIPTFQDGKVKRLQEWLEEHGESLDGAWFYSDSHNDLPLLKQVDNPVAVDPDPTLEQYAREQNWPIISLRDEVAAQS